MAETEASEKVGTASQENVAASKPECDEAAAMFKFAEHAAGRSGMAKQANAKASAESSLAQAGNTWLAEASLATATLDVVGGTRVDELPDSSDVEQWLGNIHLEIA